MVIVLCRVCGVEIASYRAEEPLIKTGLCVPCQEAIIRAADRYRIAPGDLGIPEIK